MIRSPFYVRLLLCGVLAALLCTCDGNNSPETRTEAQNKTVENSNTPTVTTTARQRRIVFFGNSLTAGYGLDEAYSFPSLIQQRIDSLELDYEVVNAGLSGDTSAGGLSRVDWILEQPLDIFVLELGANDALRGFDLNATRQNLAAILEKVRSKYPEAKLVIAGMEAPPNMGASYTQDFRHIYRELAQAYDAALIPFLLEGVAADPKLNLADGIHPNAEGQLIVRENVWKVIAPLVGATI
ncbi:MAG: arylesterase [Bacteroidetes bacterium]|nr:MAG: arylesterase [Bacteroidota bacterium]